MRVCLLKSSGRIIGSQSGGQGAEDLQVLIENAVSAGYTSDEIEARYMEEAQFSAYLAAQNDAELNYSDRRRAAYPAIGDQLDAIWKGGAAADAMRETVAAVKEKFPKL